MTHDELNTLTSKIIDASIEVHRHLGPGLLESAYRMALMYELKLRGLKAQTEVPIPAVYKDVTMDTSYRADIIVEDEIILELKATEGFHSLHKKQLSTYLKLSKRKVGLLLNFNGELMKDGITRVCLDSTYLLSTAQ